MRKIEKEETIWYVFIVLIFIIGMPLFLLYNKEKGKTKLNVTVTRFSCDSCLYQYTLEGKEIKHLDNCDYADYKGL